jgi:NAD(P)H dehydrogenase (quinone)
MTKVLVVYHSRSGNTAKMAAAVAEGARKVCAEAFEEIRRGDLGGYDRSRGIVLGAPPTSGPIRRDEGLHRRSVRIRGRLEDKIGAAFTSSGAPRAENERR